MAATYDVDQQENEYLTYEVKLKRKLSDDSIDVNQDHIS